MLGFDKIILSIFYLLSHKVHFIRRIFLAPITLFCVHFRDYYLNSLPPPVNDNLLCFKIPEPVAQTRVENWDADDVSNVKIFLAIVEKIRYIKFLGFSE